MKVINDAIKEINRELDKLFLFDAALDTVIVFLIAFLVLSMLSLPLVYPIAAAAAYLIISSIFRLRENKVLDMESKFPALREKLRTAAETANVDNPVVNELHYEVLRDLRSTEESVFLSGKKTYIKATAIAMLCFIIIALAPVALPKIKLNPFGENKIIIEGAGAGGLSRGTGSGGDLVPSKGSIYGAKTVAKLGSSELKVEIRPAGYELNIREIGAVEKRTFQEQYLGEIYTQPAEAYDENIPKEQLEVVKNYFTSVAEG